MNRKYFMSKKDVPIATIALKSQKCNLNVAYVTRYLCISRAALLAENVCARTANWIAKRIRAISVRQISVRSKVPIWFWKRLSITYNFWGCWGCLNRIIRVNYSPKKIKIIIKMKMRIRILKMKKRKVARIRILIALLKNIIFLIFILM